MDFFEDEAEEVDSDESSLGSGSEEEGFSAKRKKKDKSKKRKKVRKIVQSDEDSEEEGEDLDRDLEGLIDDNPVEEEPDSGSEEEGGKSKRDSDFDEDLEEEDFDLIEENLGIKVNRKKKLRRIRIGSDEEDSDRESGADHSEEERDTVARQIFDEGDDDAGTDAAAPAEPETHHEPSMEFGDLDDEEEQESDPDDFIVDDEGQPISQAKKKRKPVHEDAALQEAQDIFGVDFDFDEFEQYGEDYDEEEELEEDEYEEEDEVEGEEGEARPRPKKTVRRKPKGTTIYKVFEPSELERGFFTDFDTEVRTADMPERFQLRGVPVRPGDEGELEDEAEWIYKHAFITPPISRQEYYDQDSSQHGGRFNRKGPGTIMKINKALDFMRNHQFEVPFIAFYRKEYVEPELNINDLWKVYQWDEKWMQLRNRKQNLVNLFQKMQQYQFHQIDQEMPLDAHFRTLTEEDIERAKTVQTMEELRDVYQHFLLYYGQDLTKMKQFIRANRKREKEAAAGEDGEREEDEQDDEDDHFALKQATRKTGYTLCVQAGLAEVARKFGLTPEQFGENLRDNYQRYDVEQEPEEPLQLAEEFVKDQFLTPEDVMKGACHMVAMQIAHDPLVRQTIRQTVFERAKISLKTSKKGLKEIDEAHPCYTFKYLKNKLVSDLGDDQMLKISMAADDNLLTYEVHLDERDNRHETLSQPYIEEIRSLYQRDEFSNLVQEWNTQRSVALERALNLILFPQMIKELKSKLLDEAKEHVVKASCRKLYNWLKVAPYQADQQLEDDDDDFDPAQGLRVMGVAIASYRDEASFCCVVDGDGEVTDYKRLDHITKRKNHWRQDERDNKEKDLNKVKDFILAKKPHVIGVIAETRDAFRIMEDLKLAITELEQEHQMAPINVELVDNELASIYANSKKGELDFREYPVLLRQAVSISRRLQDPLIEFCQLCNTDEDILSLRYHTLQDNVSKEDLLSALYLEFINRVNEVGVDVNRCVTHAHTAPLAQFVCGLGARKGAHLLKILKQNNSRLENRTLLVTMCSMGPKVFINCAGFIKIDTTALGDSTEAYVEVLDGSRVHPETYEWARKMAIDALEYEDANPAGALEEILESPERLKDLDLDAFAVELEKQGYGNRHITLYDIRAELNHRYKDLRTPFRSPTTEECFNMITKESPQTFYIGKLIMCRVSGIAHKRPHGEQLDNANPVRNEDTQLWQCPFCRKNDFPELSEVWNHFDAGECAGQAVGVKTRLDNDVGGFIPMKMLSDKHVTDPEERVQTGMTLHCRITKIDIEKFQVELTSKTSDLVDKEGKWKLQKDPYYDYELEEIDFKKEEDKKKHQARQTYVKRVIAHPSFHNIDYRTCDKMMNNLEQGDVIIRPSSKGSDHLTVTWKVTDGVLQHIDVHEEGKSNDFSLGSSLMIGNDEFEDLDEIIARYIQPLAAFARDIVTYKYYRDADGGKQELIDKILIEDKRKQPSKIPYYFSSSRQFPGKFVIAYLPRKSTKHEFVTVTPEGLRYRGQVFSSLNSLVRWFKEHFRDPIPGTPASMKTPLGMSGRTGQTPLDPNMQRGQTPGQIPGSTVYGTPYGGMNQYQPPVATPLMTPMMTPAHAQLMTPAHHQQQQPHHLQQGSLNHPMATPVHQPPMNTPQYQPTPRSNWGGGGGGGGGGGQGAPNKNYPGTTPRHQPGGGMTPQRQHPGAMTPQRHQPGVGGSTPGSRTPGRHTPQGSRGNSSSSSGGGGGGAAGSRGGGGGGGGPMATTSQDWAKMAAMWVKNKGDHSGGSSRERRRTPRPVEDSPFTTPRGGDHTPLIDER